MAITPGTALALQIGAQVGGAALSSALGKTRTPDYITPAIDTARDNIRQTEEMMRDQERSLEAQIASSGVTGLGGVNARERLMRIASGQTASARAGVMDRINQARMAQIQAEVMMENQQLQQRRQMIMNSANAISNVIGAKSAQDQYDQRNQAVMDQRNEQVKAFVNTLPEQDRERAFSSLMLGINPTYSTPAYSFAQQQPAPQAEAQPRPAKVQPVGSVQPPQIPPVEVGLTSLRPQADLNFNSFNQKGFGALNNLTFTMPTVQPSTMGIGVPAKLR